MKWSNNDSVSASVQLHSVKWKSSQKMLNNFCDRVATQRRFFEGFWVGLVEDSIIKGDG